MYVELGPASIVVTAEKEGREYSFEEDEIRGFLGGILAGIAGSLPVLKQRACRIRNPAPLAPVARAMVEAARAVDGSSLTPMAAVAGAVGDALKEVLGERDLDFLSINNGGDISVLNRLKRPVTMGVGDIRGGEAPYLLTVPGLSEFGVATSGFGGRSFTLGVADMVTVLAATGAMADAAATYIGNAVNVESEKVKRRRAAEIDPLTDIPDELVTVEIGQLDPREVEEALARGLAQARLLKDRGIILDAAISLGGRVSGAPGEKYFSIRR